jgi:hypothetical protein
MNSDLLCSFGHGGGCSCAPGLEVGGELPPEIVMKWCGNTTGYTHCMIKGAKWKFRKL